MLFTVVGSRTFSPQTEQMLLDMATLFNQRGHKLVFYKKTLPLTLFYHRMDPPNRIRVPYPNYYNPIVDLAKLLNVPISRWQNLQTMMPLYLSILGNGTPNITDMVIAYSKDGNGTRTLEYYRNLANALNTPFYDVGHLGTYYKLMKGN